MKSKINYLIFTLSVLFFAACSKKVMIPASLATLKPVAKVMVTDKSSFPDVNRYTMTLYSDQRLELNGTSGIDKIGQHTTMLSQKEQEIFIAMIAKLKRGHFTYLDDKAQFLYDVIYYPLKKDVSMNDLIRIPLTQDLQVLLTSINDKLTYKKWLRKTDAPKFLSGGDAGNMLVTLKNGVQPSEVINDPKFQDAKFKALMQTDKTSNTWLFGFAEGMKTVDAVYKVKSNSNVLGAIPNALININENLKIFENQELIVQFNTNVNIEDWVKNYTSNEMKAVEKVAPDLNYWVVVYNASTLSAKEMLAKIKQDSKVVEAQINHKVSTRE